MCYDRVQLYKTIATVLPNPNRYQLATFCTKFSKQPTEIMAKQHSPTVNAKVHQPST